LDTVYRAVREKRGSTPFFCDIVPPFFAINCFDSSLLAWRFTRRKETSSRFSFIHRRYFFMAAKASAKKAPSKSEIYTNIAEETGLTKKDVAAVFDSLAGQIKKNLMPGLLKIKVVHKPARKARMGVNPFTGEEMMFKAKPASKGVKVLALKALKDMV
jgi:nucleoid DNA-binding protein